VSDMRRMAGNALNTMNIPLWVCSGCSTQEEGQRMCWTPKTCPQGHVWGVQHEGMFNMRGRGAGKGGAVSDTENTPTGWFLVVEGEGKGKGHPRCEEDDPGVMFFVSGVVEGEGTPQT